MVAISIGAKTLHIPLPLSVEEGSDLHKETPTIEARTRTD